MRVKTNTIFDLNKTEFLETLDGETQSYLKDVKVYFKGNIPHISLVLLEGEFIVEKRSKSLNLPVNSVVGLSEIIKNQPMDFDVIVKANSKVYVLDRTCIREFLAPLGLDIGDNHSLEKLIDLLKTGKASA